MSGFAADYLEELQALREGGKAFSAQHPEAARWLGQPGGDPDVERLLEGTAFLAARLRGRIAAVDDEVVQGLCAALLPTALRPMPACTIMRFTGGNSQREPQRVAAGSLIDSTTADGGACRFRTVWDAEVPAAAVDAVTLPVGDVPRLELHVAMHPGAVIRLLGPRLRLHAHADPPMARALVHALATARRVHAVAADGGPIPLRVAWCGPGVESPVLPRDPGLSAGHALLAEALSWPQLGHFVDLVGPRGFGQADSATGVRIIVELAALPAELRGIGPEHLLTGCAPAINLWPARAEPLLIDGTWREHQLVVAGRPAAEPWSVVRVRGAQPGGPARAWRQAREAGAGPCWQELHRDGLQLAVAGLDAAAEREVLSVDVWAGDGVRAAAIPPGGLRQGDASVPGGLQCANLSQPTWPIPAAHGGQRLRELAMRLRLAVGGVRDVDALRSILTLHGRGPAAGRWSEAVRSWRVEAAAQPVDGAVVRTLVHHLELDDGLCGGLAAAWLLGNVLERACAAWLPLGTTSSLGVTGTGRSGTLWWSPRVAGAEA